MNELNVWRRLVGAGLALLCTAAGLLPGQVDYATATLQGAVLDAQDRTVTAARVTAINETTGATKTTLSSEDSYRLPALAPGSYRVEAEARGFAKSVARGVVVTVGQVAILDLHLNVGATSTSVEVAAAIPLVQPEQTQQANVVNEVQIENLPNVTRNFVESVYTLPGVVNSFAPALQNPGVGTGFQSSGFSIGGSNGRSNLVTIDGGENDYGSGTMRAMHVPIDSVQEFQVNRNAFGAEFGFTLGTAINMVTRSGTNSWAGSAAAYFHNHGTDSGNFFDKLARPGAPKPFEQSAIFSATLGGPIRKNRLFFFTAPEVQLLHAATVRNLAGEGNFQPITAQANGYDSAAGTCPGQKAPQQQVTQACYLAQLAADQQLGALGSGLLASSVFGNPLSNPILKALVKPNDGTFDGLISGPAGSGVRAIPGFNTSRGRYYNHVTRLDYVAGIRDTVSVRFSLMKEVDDVKPQPPYSGSEPQSDYTITGTWTHVAGANKVNTLRAQAVPRNTLRNHAPAPNGSEIDLGSQVQLGTPYSYPYDAKWKRFQFDDNLSLVKGAHFFKFGGSWRPNHYEVREEVWSGGQWQFTDGAFSILNIVGAQSESAAAALAAFNVSHGYPAAGPASTNLTAVQSFLAGTPTLFIQSSPDSNPTWKAWAQSLGLYAEDAWKPSPRLTVNYGLRFDYNRDPAPVPQSARFSPRIGIAWEPSSDHKTVIRAGGGIFVAPTPFMVPFYANLLGVSGDYVNQSVLVAGLPTPPFPSIFAAWAAQASRATAAVPNPALTSAELKALGIMIGPPGPASFGNVFVTIPSGFVPAYTIQASMSAARQFGRNLTLELGYLFYRSVHVEQSIETNFVRDTSKPVDPFTGPSYVPRPGTTAGALNSAIFQNDAFSSTGLGTYHGATTSFTRRFDAGLQFQMNYTYSRAVDNTSDYSGLSTPFRPDALNRERAISDFNITHNFVANAVYTSPLKASDRGALRRLLGDMSVSPVFYARSGIPFTLLVPGMTNGTIGHAATARPWNETRNSGVGANFVSVDLRVSKVLVRRERARADLIVQAQNLLNHTNFAAVNANFPVDANYPLPGGGTLGKGPYDVSGFVPAFNSQLSQPLAYTSAFPARQVSLALRLAF